MCLQNFLIGNHIYIKPLNHHVKFYTRSVLISLNYIFKIINRVQNTITWFHKYLINKLKKLEILVEV